MLTCTRFYLSHANQRRQASWLVKPHWTANGVSASADDTEAKYVVYKPTVRVRNTMHLVSRRLWIAGQTLDKRNLSLLADTIDVVRPPSSIWNGSQSNAIRRLCYPVSVSVSCFSSRLIRIWIHLNKRNSSEQTQR